LARVIGVSHEEVVDVSDSPHETQATVRSLATSADAIAPDGMEVRLLAAGSRGSMAHFRLPPHTVGRAIRHRTVDELWFVASGTATVWMSSAGRQQTVVTSGDSFSVEAGTSFQIRNDHAMAFDAVGVTMPPWPGDGEAEFVSGPWP
jgi:mannose-6-phosphate isomerase-like protein (cupin superfamily)